MYVLKNLLYYKFRILIWNRTYFRKFGTDNIPDLFKKHLNIDTMVSFTYSISYIRFRFYSYHIAHPYLQLLGASDLLLHQLEYSLRVDNLYFVKILTYTKLMTCIPHNMVQINSLILKVIVNHEIYTCVAEFNRAMSLYHELIYVSYQRIMLSSTMGFDHLVKLGNKSISTPWLWWSRIEYSKLVGRHFVWPKLFWRHRSVVLFWQILFWTFSSILVETNDWAWIKLCSKT